MWRCAKNISRHVHLDEVVSDLVCDVQLTGGSVEVDLSLPGLCI